MLRPAPLRVKSTAGEVPLAGSFSVGLKAIPWYVLVVRIEHGG